MHRTAFRRSISGTQPGLVLAIVPARLGADAKQRLASVLPPEARRRLAMAMLEDVLAALAASSGVGSILVAAGDADALDLALRCGALWLEEPIGGLGLNAALARALNLQPTLPPRAGVGAYSGAGADGAGTSFRAGPALIVMGDVPLLEAADVDLMLDQLHRDGPAAIAAVSRDGTGTNALALSDPSLFAPAFGPFSLARHRAAATLGGIRWAELALPRVALDIDTPEDLLRLRSEARPESATGRCLADFTTDVVSEIQQGDGTTRRAVANS